MILAFRLVPLVDTIFHKRAFMAVDDEFRVVDLHRVAGLNDGLRSPQKQLGLKGIIRVSFVAQRAQIVSDMVRAAEQRNNLVQGMHTKAIELAVLRAAGLVSASGTVVVKMAFNLHQFAKFAALNHLLVVRKQESKRRFW